MDAGNHVAVEILPIIRVYKDGRVERLAGKDVIPPSHDPATGVTSKDVVIDLETGITARLYLPDAAAVASEKKLPVVVYYHGGGFCIGSAGSVVLHPFLNSLVARAGVVAVSVNYRLAPENPIPAAYDDSWRALQWVLAPGSDEWLRGHADVSRVFLAGESAGGNISHNLAIRAGEGELGVSLAGVALIHPSFWGPTRMGAEAEERPTIVSKSAMDATWPLVCPGAAAAGVVDDPRFNPLAEGAPSLAGLGCGRVLVAVAGEDLLRDRGFAYYESLKASGYRGEIEDVFETEGEDHVFHLFKPGCDKAAELLQRLVDFFHP